MQQLKKHKKTVYGDTLVEVIIAIAVFSVVSILSMNMMNSGLFSAQKNLEISMAKLAVDSESDTIRFLYDMYLTGKNSRVDELWKKYLLADDKKYITEQDVIDINAADSCESALNDEKRDGNREVFAFNPRAVVSLGENNNVPYFGLMSDGKDLNTRKGIEEAELVTSNKIMAAPLYPRLVYSTVDDTTYGSSSNRIVLGKIISNSKAQDHLAGSIAYSCYSGGAVKTCYQSNIVNQSEGIWVVAKKNESTNAAFSGEVESYDFYVRTCWNAVGSKSKTTMTSLVRIYNAELKN